MLMGTVVIMGCNTASKYGAQGGGEKPPTRAGRVKIASYDSVSRQPTHSLEVYDTPQQIPRLYKVIALLACEGAAHEEGMMVNAINYRARQLGANGVIVLPTDRSGAVFSPQSDRRVFRRKAIVYTDNSN